MEIKGDCEICKNKNLWGYWVPNTMARKKIFYCLVCYDDILKYNRNYEFIINSPPKKEKKILK